MSHGSLKSHSLPYPPPTQSPTPGLRTGAAAASPNCLAAKLSQSPASCAKASPPGQEGIYLEPARRFAHFLHFITSVGPGKAGRARMLASKWIQHAGAPGPTGLTYMFFWARMMALTSSAFTMLRMRLQKTLEAGIRGVHLFLLLRCLKQAGRKNFPSASGSRVGWIRASGNPASHRVGHAT